MLSIKFIRSLSLIFLVLSFSQIGMAQVKKGEIVPKELCKADTNYSYAYYLPSDYTPLKEWPVIFVFEPGARGTLGVEVFRKMAENHGYVVFCSNDAKNGPTQLIYDAAEAMFVDVYSKFSLWNERTFMSGFSGGSRVSSRLAMMTGKVNTVIGVGAAFPERIEKMDVTFDYYGMAGTLDFNYSEMMMLEKTLDSLGVYNAFSIFDGPHQWPPPLQIEMAILWIELQDMKQGVLEFDDRILQRYVFIMDSLQIDYDKAGRTLDRIRTLKNWQSAVEGIGDTYKPDSILHKLLGNPQVQQALTDNESLLAKEVALRLELKEGLYGIILPYMYSEQTNNWWKNWLDRINEFKSDSSIQVQRMGTRLQSTITANCWMEYYIYMDEGSPDKAFKFLNIWKIFEPESIGLHWLLAKYYTETGNKKKAVDHLQVCRELGMKNYTRLQNDATFSKLNGYKKFDQLIVEMDTIK